MTERVEQPDATFVIEGDVYKVQRRPMHGEIVINDDYRGIRIIDVWSGKDVRRLRFPNRDARPTIITEWCFRSDGEWSLIFSAESAMGWLMSLGPDRRAWVLDVSGVGSLHDLRYIWHGDSFWMTAGKSQRFFTLEWGDEVRGLVERSSIEVRAKHPGWRRAVDLLPPDRYNVLRVQPDESRLLYHEFAGPQTRVGVVDWQTETKMAVDVETEEVPMMAAYGARIFTLQEDEVQCLNTNGRKERVYPAPDGFYYCGLDTAPPYGDDSAALALVCTAQVDSRHSQMRVYGLSS
jgi:hypothetical protein